MGDKELFDASFKVGRTAAKISMVVFAIVFLYSLMQHLAEMTP